MELSEIRWNQEVWVEPSKDGRLYQAPVKVIVKGIFGNKVASYIELSTRAGNEKYKVWGSRSPQEIYETPELLVAAIQNRLKKEIEARVEAIADVARDLDRLRLGAD